MKTSLQKYKLKYLLIFLIINIISTSLIRSNESKWHVQEGWAYRNSEKFFAIGIWGIPKYNFILNTVDTSNENKSIFQETAEIFNLIYTQLAREQEYMSNSLLFTGASAFRWKMLKGYSGNHAYKLDLNDNGELDYKEMQFFKNNLNNYYKTYIKTAVVSEIKERLKSYDYIWFLMDEPDTGGRGWVWYPSILQAYHNAVKELADSALTFVDLFGTIRGDRLLYELKYIEKFNLLPDDLPSGTDSTLMQGDPNWLDSYLYSSNGTPVYVFDKHTNSWKPQAINKFKDQYYSNVYKIATMYNTVADIIGVNCYTDFLFYPDAAGIVVDAIKAACGKDKPVWLFFDGAAHQKRESMSFDDYAQVIKCQIYTSIVHGASGVLFWSKTDTDPKYWKLVKQLAIELDINSSIFKGIEIESRRVNSIHYSIRVTQSNKKYAIIVNTDFNHSFPFILKNKSIILKPLEVKIIEMSYY